MMLLLIGRMSCGITLLNTEDTKEINVVGTDFSRKIY
jgi:hypothetical protein